jgi:ATP-dependent DNA helicase PIF1
MSRLNVVHLTKIYRQGDVIFQNMLSRLRMGIVTPEDRAILQSRVVRKMPKIDPNSGNPNDLILPTKLYPYRKDVEGINEEEYQKIMIINAQKAAAAGGGGGGGGIGGGGIGGDWHYFPIYTIEVHTKKLVQSNMHVNHLVNTLRNDLQRCSGKVVFEGLKLRENVKVKLCVGAQVMLNYNLDVSAGLANGVKGVVMAFDQAGNPSVQFDGFSVPITVVRVDHLHFTEFYKLTITQYPLDLAWASTIHKSQGLSLSKIITNLSNVFSPGQSYVCLSRVKSLDGLYLMGIDYNKIKCNQTARKFYYDLKYYCEYHYMSDCRDLISTSSWLKHPNICDHCMSYFLTVWVNNLPFELNMIIVEYLEKF